MHNELESGHLERFIKWNLSLYDNLIVLDDFSTDDSVEFMEPYADLIIKNSMNSFKSELRNKNILLNKAVEYFPDTDWFLWLDADELILDSRLNIESLLIETSQLNCDGIQLGLVNLWKSENHYRIDSGFNDVKNVRFWKNNGKLKFEIKNGLHNLMHPQGIQKIRTYDGLKVLHFGFSSVKCIVNKYAVYKSNGQRGKNLWRLIDESSIQLKEIKEEKEFLGSRFSDFYSISRESIDIDKKLSLSDYVGMADALSLRNKTQPVVTLVSLIYSGIDWLEFQYGELLKLKNEFGPGEVEILFIANDANQDVVNFLKMNSIPFKVAPGRKYKDEWYINSVYRAYNFGVKESKGEYVLLVNSDMAYAPGFLYNIMQNRSKNKYLVGKLIESGRLTPANSAIRANLGKKIKNFKRLKFYKLAQGISRNSLSYGGLYMPSLVNREVFLNNGGFPEGNLKTNTLHTFLQSKIFDAANMGDIVLPGDAVFIKLLQQKGITHETVNNAIAYHFQEGEKSEYSKEINSYTSTGIGINTKSTLRRKIIQNNYNKLTFIKEFSSFTKYNPRVEFLFSDELIYTSKKSRKILVDIPSFNNQVMSAKNIKNLNIASIITSSSDTILKNVGETNCHGYMILGLEETFEYGIIPQFDLQDIISKEFELSFAIDNYLSFIDKIKNLIPHKIKKLIKIFLKEL